jgi:hypothetical protein
MECLYNKVGGAKVSAARWKQMLVLNQSILYDVHWNCVANYLRLESGIKSLRRIKRDMTAAYGLRHWMHELYDYERMVWSPNSGERMQQLFPAPPSPKATFDHHFYTRDHSEIFEERDEDSGSADLLWQQKQGFLTTGGKRRPLSTYVRPPSPIDFDAEGGIFHVANEIENGHGDHIFPELFINSRG